MSQGRIRGVRIADVVRYLGIPYAAAPYGPNRFRAPQPPPVWPGVRDCAAYGPTALKPPQPDVFERLLPDPAIPGEDCLTLNVWAPVDAHALPVLVWVHGGGYMTGSGAVPIYDGTSFARHGVVCVTINYRLGVDGFALLPDAPANRGLLDAVVALQWVRDEIAAFGGDPRRITIAGQSAGAMAVTTLLAMPSARGLFGRAIAQSGAGHHALSPGTASRVVAALAADLGVPATAAGLGGVEPDRLVAAGAALTERFAEAVMPFQPVVDGDTLPALPIECLSSGAGAACDLLIGTNSDEFTLWSVPTGLADTIDDAALDALLAGFGVRRAAYAAARPGGTAAQLYADVMTDWAFRVPAIRAMEARAAGPGRTYAYEFGWPSPLFGGRLGATHASEVAFGFDNLSVDWARELRGGHGPQALADELHGAFVAFVRDGDPGWPAYGPERVVRRFGDPGGLLSDPAAARREAWIGLR